jgi:hypothetical protein
VSILDAVAIFCIDLTIGALLGRVFKARPNMRNTLFCEPCELEGKRVAAEKIYHIALVKPPVGDVLVCLKCAGTLRYWRGALVDIADA